MGDWQEHTKTRGARNIKWETQTGARKSNLSKFSTERKLGFLATFNFDWLREHGGLSWLIYILLDGRDATADTTTRVPLSLNHRVTCFTQLVRFLIILFFFLLFLFNLFIFYYFIFMVVTFSLVPWDLKVPWWVVKHRRPLDWNSLNLMRFFSLAPLSSIFLSPLSTFPSNPWVLFTPGLGLAFLSRPLYQSPLRLYYHSFLFSFSFFPLIQLLKEGIW